MEGGHRVGQDAHSLFGDVPRANEMPSLSPWDTEARRYPPSATCSGGER